jgi:hypothetical protein
MSQDDSKAVLVCRISRNFEHFQVKLNIHAKGDCGCSSFFELWTQIWPFLAGNQLSSTWQIDCN